MAAAIAPSIKAKKIGLACDRVIEKVVRSEDYINILTLA
jgi:hypothetical protein